MSDDGQKRVNFLIPEKEYEELLKNTEANISTILRELIRDFLSPHKLTLKVSEHTKSLYDILSASEKAADQAVEPFLREGMKKLLDKRIRDLEKLKKQL